MTDKECETWTPENYATITGHSVDAETARLVADRDQVLSEKLAAVGLIARREFHDCELVGFVRKHCGFAKHFAKQAVEQEIIRKNPFADLVSASIGNGPGRRI